MRNVRAKVQLFSPIPSFISCVIRKYCKICNAWVSHKCLFGNFAFFVNMYVFFYSKLSRSPNLSLERMWEEFFSLFAWLLHEWITWVFLKVCKWAWCIHLQGAISVKVCLSSTHRKTHRVRVAEWSGLLSCAAFPDCQLYPPCSVFGKQACGAY